MRIAPVLAAVALAACAHPRAGPLPDDPGRKLLLLLTGDGHGEVAPCG